MLFFQQKNVSFVFFFISRSSSLSLFSPLSFAGLPPTFFFSLSFSFSFFCLPLYFKFVGMTINLSLILWQHGCRNNFRFRLYWLFSCLCFTRRGWLCNLKPKWPRVAFGLPYLLIELFYIGVPVLRTDGRSDVQWHGHQTSHWQDKINEVSSIRYKHCEKGMKVTFFALVCMRRIEIAKIDQFRYIKIHAWQRCLGE